MLEPSIFGGKYVLQRATLESFWIDVELPDSAEFVGTEELVIAVTVKSRDGSIILADQKLSLEIEVINAALPEQELIMTQWFYCDTLAEYYNVPVWSEEHFRIIENFARLAVKRGQNMLLTPLLTPSLDTYIGGERLTTQLVKIKKRKNKYSFNFKLLDRWIEMCDRIGIKYLEMSHLFSQWGATHAPKVVCEISGKEKQIFGWNTDAHSKEYGDFLRALLSALLAHLKKSGNDKRCFFHISDEPNEQQLEDYKKSQAQVEEVLSGYTIMDAMSHFEYYSMGVMKTPIPKTESMAPFIEAGVSNMWTYYCGTAGKGCSSRMLAMTAAKNRALGMQLYKYNIMGFLHWGYNFYNTCQSHSPINPFSDQSGEMWVPAGDMFMVYPGCRGEPLESTRLLVFDDGLKDMRAMKLCERLYSHEEVVAAIEEAAGIDIKFNNTICDASTVLKIRERINEMIKARI